VTRKTRGTRTSSDHTPQGHIDLVFMDERTGQVVIVDIKTGTQVPKNPIKMGQI